jgi:hypothetical protein
MSEDIGVFEARRLQIEAWDRSHIGLKIKWWLFGMPESKTLQQWLHHQESAFTQEQERQIRRIMREELQKESDDSAPGDGETDDDDDVALTGTFQR